MRSFRSNKEVGDFFIFVIFINIIVCWIFSHFSNRCLARVLSREFPEQWTRKDLSWQLEFGTAAAFQPESTVDECRCYRVRFPLFMSGSVFCYPAKEKHCLTTSTLQLRSFGEKESLCNYILCLFLFERKIWQVFDPLQKLQLIPIFSSYCCINCKGALPGPLGNALCISSILQ